MRLLDNAPTLSPIINSGTAISTLQTDGQAGVVVEIIRGLAKVEDV